MAAPASAITISRAAQILAQEEELLWDLMFGMEPEDGCLWVRGTTINRQLPSRPRDSNICAKLPRSRADGYLSCASGGSESNMNLWLSSSLLSDAMC